MRILLYGTRSTYVKDGNTLLVEEASHKHRGLRV